MTHPLSMWDAVTECCVSSFEAGVDPGYWNYTRLRGIDSQTDTPDPKDPLFWMSGSMSDVSRIIADLVHTMEQDVLASSSTKESRDNLQLRADNIILRVEVAELKRKLAQPARKVTSDSPVSSHHCSPYKASMAGLVGGTSVSASFVVAVDAGLEVTSSLAPSSSVLGRLKMGDQVLTAGSPEAIGDLVRGPIFPRGWVTIRDENHVYLRKP